MSHLDSSPDPVTPTNLVSPKFTCELQREGRAAAWIRLGGELDLGTAPEFKEALEQALDHALLVIVDLRELTFMDSSGIHALLLAETRATEAGRRLVLVRGQAQVDRLFALVGLADRVEIIDLGLGEIAAAGRRISGNSHPPC